MKKMQDVGFKDRRPLFIAPDPERLTWWPEIIGTAVVLVALLADWQGLLA